MSSPGAQFAIDADSVILDLRSEVAQLVSTNAVMRAQLRSADRVVADLRAELAAAKGATGEVVGADDGTVAG